MRTVTKPGSLPPVMPTTPWYLQCLHLLWSQSRLDLSDPLCPRHQASSSRQEEGTAMQLPVTLETDQSVPCSSFHLWTFTPQLESIRVSPCGNENLNQYLHPHLLGSPLCYSHGVQQRQTHQGLCPQVTLTMRQSKFLQSKWGQVPGENEWMWDLQIRESGDSFVE